MNRLAWYEFIFDLPDAWEITHYSTSAPSGRCDFATRQGPLARLSWEQSKRDPDEERILSEYHRRYLQRFDTDQAKGFAGIKTATVGAFKVGYRNVGEPCQAVTHIPESGTTVMWLFPEFSVAQMEEVWKPVLKTFKPNTADLRQWAAFGIRGVLPRDFELEKAVCKPADVSFEFQHKNLHRVHLHRWGLPRELLRENDMDAFIRQIIRRQEGRVLNSRVEEWRGMDSVKIELESRGTRGMDRLYSSYWQGQGRIWHNTDEKRLYAWMQVAPKKVTPIEERELLPE